MRWALFAMVAASATLSACSDSASCFEWYAPCTVTCPDMSSHPENLRTCAPSFQAGGPTLGPATYCLYQGDAQALCAPPADLPQIVCTCTPWVSTTVECACPQ